MNVDAVPESISRYDYLALMRAVGFTPEDLIELRFATDGIYATVPVTDDSGRMVRDGEEVATHTIFVKVVD